MRPDRSDIAIPPFPPGVHWVGGEPVDGERLTARGPLLVHFFELGELSGVRTLPFVSGLDAHYRDAGLSVLGVHSPRSGLARSTAALEAALARHELDFPVANDDQHRIWHAYGCGGWPSTFLWDRGGILSWVHFGEGAYHETEEAIRVALGGDRSRLPEPMLPAPAAGDEPELGPPSDEVFPGGSHDRIWRPDAGEPLAVEYAGGGAWAALDGSGCVRVDVDGDPSGDFELAGPGLYELARHDEHGMHEVTLHFDGPIGVWSIAFAPGRKP